MPARFVQARAFLGACRLLVVVPDAIAEVLEVLAPPLLHLVQHLALGLGTRRRFQVRPLPLDPVAVVSAPLHHRLLPAHRPARARGSLALGVLRRELLGPVGLHLAVVLDEGVALRAHVLEVCARARVQVLAALHFARALDVEAHVPRVVRVLLPRVLAPAIPRGFPALGPGRALLRLGVPVVGPALVLRHHVQPALVDARQARLRPLAAHLVLVQLLLVARGLALDTRAAGRLRPPVPFARFMVAAVPALVARGALLVAVPHDLVVLVEALVGVRHLLLARARRLGHLFVLVGGALHCAPAARVPVDNAAKQAHLAPRVVLDIAEITVVVLGARLGRCGLLEPFVLAAAIKVKHLLKARLHLGNGRFVFGTPAHGLLRGLDLLAVPHVAFLLLAHLLGTLVRLGDTLTFLALARALCTPLLHARTQQLLEVCIA